MSQIVDAGSGSTLNASNANCVTLVHHLPGLPAPSEKYSNSVCYDKRDTCFYRCKQNEGGSWSWEKVTTGFRRNFLIPVATLSTESTFSDIVKTINVVVGYLNDFYCYAFDPVNSNSYGSTEEAAVEKFNELVDFINHVCSTNLVKADLLSNNADTLNDIVPKMNEFIFVINPAAAAISLVRDIAKIRSSDSAKTIATAIVNSAQQLQQLANQFIGDNYGN